MSPRTLIPNHTAYNQPLGNLLMDPRATTVVRSTEEWKASRMHSIGSHCRLKLWNIRILSAAFRDCGNTPDMHWKIIPKDLQMICFLFLKPSLLWISLSVSRVLLFSLWTLSFCLFPFLYKAFSEHWTAGGLVLLDLSPLNRQPLTAGRKRPLTVYLCPLRATKWMCLKGFSYFQ